jgi:Fe-S cluster biogenesis protein NfuA
MKVITAKDINQMILNKIQEELKVTSGKGKKQKVIISKGFKIMHLESGLTYTVDEVVVVKRIPIIHAHSGDNSKIVIHPADFKQYKGL